MSDMVHIYALCDPNTEEIHYIGQSRNPRMRLSQHVYLSKSKCTSKDKWIDSLLKLGLRPKIRILKTVEENEADRAEREAIKELGTKAKLTNRTNGNAGAGAEKIVLQPIHLGQDEQGERRRQALEQMAAEAGYYWNNQPSVGRWLVALADQRLQESTMNAEKKIREALKTVFDPADVNAMEVYKGFAVDTGFTGWHYKWFGRSEHTYLGNSVDEALAAIEEMKREQDPE